ncbi:hypothetical protein BDV95DRAFT_358579 [Massariosphaeria phaeospora]|uniref:C2H2-type domain-containing protein n=1 Tax=Massariosphaeria phaeospora TaxID=100035 RepID=A0A7C8MA16_9PLEO|nr:hypothetical protein BDV95DRAFT_358579 [Massariosphaeria phaeospora]
MEKSSINDHARKHKDEIRSPFRCHLCDVHFAEMFTLAAHVSRCTGDGYAERFTSYRYVFGQDLPSIIIVVRSSCDPPDSWKASTSSREEGLHLFGRKVLQHFHSIYGFRNQSAVMHMVYNAPTR